MKKQEKEVLKQSINDSLQENDIIAVIKISCRKFDFNYKIFFTITVVMMGIYISSSYQCYLAREIVEKIITFSSNTVLALLAIVVTGYSIFQALLSRKILLLFMSQTDKKINESVFNSMQHKFFFLSFLYIILLLLSYFITLIVILFPNDVIPYQIIIILLSIYNTVIFYGIFEMNYFIFNLYQTFKIFSIEEIIAENDHL